MTENNIRISKSDLENYTAAIFAAAGLSRDYAAEWAKMLVWANLRGTDSHGIIRIPRYIDLVKAKSINPAPDIRIERRSTAAVVLEADRAPSAVALTRAMSEAMDCAKSSGVGWCAARHITHTGAIGYFALQAAEKGFCGIAMSASGPMMAYPGTRAAAVSSNPIAFAIPRANGRPFLLDFSTGVVANGKIMGAADRGEKIPAGWGLDKDGNDTTDPKAVETLLPMGGAKGAGLSFMIECLTSLLLSQPRLAPDLESWAIGDDPFLNGSVVAIDPGAFGDRERFLAEAERLGTAIAALPRAAGVDRILLPGERGDAVRAEREAAGIPIPKGTWQRIGKTAATLGVTPPM
ncbi:MAG: Ldh family oxidoreductase [Alphaproteobacteria bacterium]|nr:Ldh family oxidoreductase [Alphaproteobacteria bacterium]